MARRVLAGWIAGSLVLGLVPSPALAETPKPAAPAPKAALPDPAFEAAKAAFEALPEAERRGLQDALVWTGDLNSVVTGSFGKRTYEALLAHRTRSHGAGLLDAPARAALLKTGAAARAQAGFVVKPDPASGTVLGLPERLLPKREPIPGGTRWQSADGRITVEAKALPPGETNLEALFARLTAPTPERRVTYKLQRPDFLVVTAETATGKSYIRYAAGAGGLRGLTLGYDKGLAESFDRLVIAIANSFVPFPDAAPVAQAAPVPPPPAVQAAAPAATGLVVAPGRVLTSAAAVAGCVAPRIAGRAAGIAARDAALVLLDVGDGGKAGPAPILRPEGTAAFDGLVLSAGDGNAVTAAPGAVAADGRITAPLQPGSGGAPVVDEAGLLAGLVGAYPQAPRMVAGVVPPARYDMIPARQIGAFLAAAGVVLPASLGRLAGAIVAITCQP